MDAALIIVAAIFIITYVLIISEKVHRTTAAMLGALCMVAVGMNFERLSSEVRNLVEQFFDYIDFNTIGLLLGMMMIVGVLSDTGFFEFVAIKVAKISRGDPWKLLVLFGTTTAFLSMFLDNVTTILLIIPVTFAITKELEIAPIPIILAEAMLSNVGGVATLIGDPPNIMIGSAAGFSFNDFIIHLLPITLLVLGISLVISKVLFKDWLKSKPKNIEKILAMNEYDVIKHPQTLKKTGIILVITMVLFILHDYIGLLPALVALIGATLTLLVNHADPGRVLEKVEWPTLIFFGSLFVLVGGLEHVGILEMIAKKVIELSGGDVIIAALLLLWFSAICASILDRIPFTAAMIPIVLVMGKEGMDINILWWALAMGVGFGGNGTPIGSTVGVITMGVSDAYGAPVTFKSWLKAGIPLVILALTLVSVFIVLCPWMFR